MAGKPLVKRDRRYRNGYRVTVHGQRVMLASATGFVIWVVLLIASPTLGAWFTLAALVYIVGRVAIKLHDRFGRPAAPPPARYLPPPAPAYLPPPPLAYPPAPAVGRAQLACYPAGREDCRRSSGRRPLPPVRSPRRTCTSITSFPGPRGALTRSATSNCCAVRATGAKAQTISPFSQPGRAPLARASAPVAMPPRRAERAAFRHDHEPGEQKAVGATL